MKNQFNITLLSLLVFMGLSLTSCDLDEYNPSGSTTDVIWTTPDGFETLVNACYENQYIWYGKMDGVLMSEVGTDIWFPKEKDGYGKELTKYENFNPTTGNPNKATWPLLYESLNLCNTGIDRIDEAGFVDIERKNEKEGEIRFLRAFYLWHIVETWGGVYLPLHETKEVILTATRSSVEDFYEVIISDLLFAVEHLPYSQNEEYSRATKKSAMGMLARAYLSRAYHSTGSEAQEYFTLARNISQEIINNQTELGIALWEDYADMWDPDNNKQNQEALHTVSNSANDPNLNYDLNANRLHMYFLMNYTTKPGLSISFEYGNPEGRRLMPTLFLLDLFDETIDSRYHVSFQEVWLANDTAKIPVWEMDELVELGMDINLEGTRKYEIGDTAMYITKKSVTEDPNSLFLTIDRDSVYNTSGNGEIKLGTDYIPLIKHIDPFTRPTPGAVPGYNDIIVIRLAEIYLIAAEAELQLGNSSTAAEHINVLRTRAAIKEPLDHTAEMQISSGDVTLDFILDERARELCGEHMRWFDLKRTKKLLERVEKYNPDIEYLEKHHYLRPIPQTELDLLTNGEEFGQNEGYY
jgi:hypothetical protein